MEIFPDKLVSLRIGPGDMTINLVQGVAAGVEGKEEGLIISGLDRGFGEIDGRRIHPGGSAGLQPSARKTQVLEKIRQAVGGGLSYPPALLFFFSAMHESSQEGACGKNHRPAGQLAAIAQPHTRDPRGFSLARLEQQG